MLRLLFAGILDRASLGKLVELEVMKNKGTQILRHFKELFYEL